MENTVNPAKSRSNNGNRIDMKTMYLSSLLKKGCEPINDAIIEEMSKLRAKVIIDYTASNSGKIKLALDDKKELNTNPCLYRWLVSEEFIQKYLQKYTNDKNNYPELEGIIFHEKNQRIIGDTTYYAIYFGKSGDGNNRIINQHLRGTIKKSTLRQTLYGLFVKENENTIYTTKKEPEISKLFENSYFEWLHFDKKDKERIVAYESICIALGSYLLNLDGNPTIRDNWYQYVMKRRKLNKK